MATLISKCKVQLGGNKGVLLVAGRPQRVSDERVDELLDAGNGLGRKLLAAGQLRVEFDETTDGRERKQRIDTAVEACLRAESLMRALGPDELSDAHAALDREKLHADGSAKGPKSGGPGSALTPLTIGDLTATQLEPLIVDCDDAALLADLGAAEQAGKARKGVLAMLEQRFGELTEPQTTED